MHYINEQITKTFEHLLNLYYKYHSISLPRKYRINQKKLDKYHSQNNSKYNIEEKNVIPRIKHLSDRKSISTQTTFNKKIDLIHPSPNTLSIISKETNELDISTSLSSSSLSNITIKNSKSSSTEFDFSNKSYSDLSIKTDSYKFNDYSSKPQSKNSRVYIRSIVRHMLSDDTSDEG